MPRKRKPEKTVAERYIEAKRELDEAKKRVEYYERQLHPWRQQLLAELAATGAPESRPDDFFDPEHPDETGEDFAQPGDYLGKSA